MKTVFTEFTGYHNDRECSPKTRHDFFHIINAGEGVEKREPSYTVGGNAN